MSPVFAFPLNGADIAGTIKSGLLVVHLVGLVVGLGAAATLDVIFVRLIAPRRITQDYWPVVQLLSRMATLGLALLWISGIGFLILYSRFDPHNLQNGKIWAKVVIVAVLTLNGVFIHSHVLPAMEQRVGRGMFDDLSFTKRSILIASGVISGVSWCVPLLLGALPQLNFTVSAAIILYVYVALLVAALGLTLLVQMLVSSRRPSHGLGLEIAARADHLQRPAGTPEPTDLRLAEQRG